MGGCYSTPKELDGPTVKKPAEPAVTAKPVGSQGNAPTEVQAEPAAESEIEEQPLVDLSEPNPEDETNEVMVAVLSPEISGLMADTPEGNENETVKDAPVAEQAIVTEQKGNVAEEAEKFEDKVSAPRGNGDMRS